MKESRKRECSIILLLVMIIFSQNVYAFSQLATGYWALARNIMQLLLLAVLALGILQKREVNIKSLCVYLVFVSSMLFGMFWHMDFAGTYWVLDCTIAFLFVELYDEFSIAEKFEKIMFIICSIYTMLYVFTLFFFEILKTPIYNFLEKMHIVWHHSSMYQYYVSGVVPLRSYAIFREPGVYQMFIILAALIELFVRRKMRWWHVGLYGVALLATHSTTGYMCLLLVAVMVIIKYMKKNRLMVLGAIGAVLVAIPLLPRVLGSILTKFTVTGESSHSWLSRQASILTNLYLWKQNPIIGVGISHIYENFSIVTRDVFGLQAGTYSINDDTNTVLLFFAAYGIVAGSLFVIGTYGWCKRVAQGKLLTLILFVICIFLYSGEALNSTCYPYILFFIGMSYFVNPKMVRKCGDER